jgi:hypothetical protein
MLPIRKKAIFQLCALLPLFYCGLSDLPSILSDDYLTKLRLRKLSNISEIKIGDCASGIARSVNFRRDATDNSSSRKMQYLSNFLWNGEYQLAVICDDKAVRTIQFIRVIKARPDDKKVIFTFALPASAQKPLRADSIEIEKNWPNPSV